MTALTLHPYAKCRQMSRPSRRPIERGVTMTAYARVGVAFKELYVCLEIPRELWHKAAAGDQLAQAIVLEQSVTPAMQQRFPFYHWRHAPWSIFQFEYLCLILIFPAGRRARQQPACQARPIRARHSHETMPLRLVTAQDTIVLASDCQSVQP